MRPLKVLHTSDVHLESDSVGAGPNGERMRERLRSAFSQVISIANQRQADLLLIVGDLFDSSRIADRALDFAFGEIGRARMEVVMVPGNHDAHDERSIYAAIAASRLPANLHLILEPDGHAIDFPDLAARTWGRALVEHSPDYRPLARIPAPAPGRWNIALAHGLFTDDAGSERSSQITAAEIAASAYHYVALGHVHVFSDVSQAATRAAYCGTPAPLYSNDQAGSAAWVTFVPGATPQLEQIVIKG
ncbi:MAG TPA: metallophosphoesterase [Candidatus Binataceae bacterium]|nr:metallophosphoesterase [Candidatus Binataceae bacterium]